MFRSCPIQYSGVIINYACTAQCKHCMFAGAPKGSRDFITPEAADRIALRLHQAGVDSVHIGGGEPFMRFDALCEILSALQKHRVGIDYIETNAFWCRDRETVSQRLKTVRSLGADTVMASVDPFHIEFVPLERPLLLVETLEKLHMGYFIWQERFLRRLMALDLHTTHSPKELKAALGEDYVADTASEYGIGMNGRALRIAREMYPLRPAEEAAEKKPCAKLLSGRHCHVDLYENIISCPGISMGFEDFLEAASPSSLPSDAAVLDNARYPVVSRLLTGGTSALLQYGREKGFQEDPNGYASKCDLCYGLRKYLLSAAPSKDIAPACFYEML